MDERAPARPPLIDRFLIDECLSVGLVAVAKDRGVVADYGPHIGKRGWSDWSLVQFAIENSYVVVTANRRDFLKAYARLPLHNGLIVMAPGTGRSDQARLFGIALDVAVRHSQTLLNTVVEILDTGHVDVREWTSACWDDLHIDRLGW